MVGKANVKEWRREGETDSGSGIENKGEIWWEWWGGGDKKITRPLFCAFHEKGRTKDCNHMDDLTDRHGRWRRKMRRTTSNTHSGIMRKPRLFSKRAFMACMVAELLELLLTS